MNLTQKVLISLALAIVLCMAWLIMFGDKGWLELVHFRQELKDLQTKNNEIVQENVAFHRKMQRLKRDPQYIESIAKQELGFVRENEIILKIAPENSN